MLEHRCLSCEELVVDLLVKEAMKEICEMIMDIHLGRISERTRTDSAHMHMDQVVKEVLERIVDFPRQRTPERIAKPGGLGGHGHSPGTLPERIGEQSAEAPMARSMNEERVQNRTVE